MRRYEASVWTKKYFFFHLVSVAIQDWSPCSNRLMIPSTGPTRYGSPVGYTYTKQHKKIKRNTNYYKRIQANGIQANSFIIFLLRIVAQTSDSVPWPRTCNLKQANGGDITLELNPSFVLAQVNLDKVHLSVANQVDIDDIKLEWNPSFVYIHLGWF